MPTPIEATQRKTIAVFGGSFNPPHVAHQMLALYALQTTDIDEVWMVPTYRHVFGKELAPFEHRVAMCELLAAPLGGRVMVCQAERALATDPSFVASRTIDLLQYLQFQYPLHALRLLIGADILNETSKWHRWQDVIALAPPIVIGRGNVANVPGWDISEFAMPAVSSTEVRARLAVRQDAGWLVPSSVLRYIAAKGLYQ
jgi:nicotinate-nucleotide adenylyltransferase